MSSHLMLKPGHVFNPYYVFDIEYDNQRQLLMVYA